MIYIHCMISIYFRLCYVLKLCCIFQVAGLIQLLYLKLTECKSEEPYHQYRWCRFTFLMFICNEPMLLAYSCKKIIELMTIEVHYIYPIGFYFIREVFGKLWECRKFWIQNMLIIFSFSWVYCCNGYHSLSVEGRGRGRGRKPLYTVLWTEFLEF